MNQLTYIFCLITFSTVILGSCNEPKDIATKRLDRSFIIGSGGGFTGAYEMFQVHSTGKIELQNADGTSYSHLKTLPSDSVNLTFSTLDALSLDDYQFSQPGNMTYIIEVAIDGETNTIQWGAANRPIRQDIDSFFKRTTKMIRADYE
jgi:hypothetical protein